MTLAEMLTLRDMRRAELIELAREYGADGIEHMTNDAIRLAIIFSVIRRGEVEDEGVERV